MAADSRSAQALVQELRGRGLSTKEIADELRRSPRMVNKVLRGESSGAAYRATLLELANTGHATTRTPRRRNKSGEIVPVRAKKGSEVKTVVPEDTTGRYTEAKQGGRYTSTTYLGGGGRQHEIHMPKGKKAKGREAASEDMVNKVRAAAKSQAGGNQKRVKMSLTFANGRVMEVKDYNASTLLDRIKTSGDALGFLVDATKNRYHDLDLTKETITGVTMTVYDTPKTKQYHDKHAAKS